MPVPASRPTRPGERRPSSWLGSLARPEVLRVDRRDALERRMGVLGPRVLLRAGRVAQHVSGQLTDLACEVRCPIALVGAGALVGGGTSGIQEPQRVARIRRPEERRGRVAPEARALARAVMEEVEL